MKNSKWRKNNGILLHTVLLITLMIKTSHSHDINQVGAADLEISSYSKRSSIINRFERSIDESNENEKNICQTPECRSAAADVLKKMDLSEDPCNNFYHFACGNFLKNTVIPDDKSTVNIFSTIDNEIQKQLRVVIEEPITPNEIKPFKLAKNLYKSCMNLSAIEARGLDPAIEVFDKLGGWPVLEEDEWNEDNFDWIKLSYKFEDAGYLSDFLSFKIGADAENSTKRVIMLDQPSLGLDQDYLLRGFDDDIVKAYYDYMVDTAVIFGAKKERAEKELMESLKFQMELAKISTPPEERRDASRLYNPMTIEELNKNYPFISWKEFLNGIYPSKIHVDDDEKIIVRSPNFLANLGKLMDKTPKRVQANYAMWSIVDSTGFGLNDAIRKRRQQYFTAFTGTAEGRPRWTSCMDITSEVLSISVGALYVRKYFDREAKKNALDMIDHLRKEFIQILKTVDWMDDETRKRALEKAAAMINLIAYADELLDDKKLEDYYKELEIVDDNYFQGLWNGFHFLNLKSFDRLRQPVNKTYWASEMSPATVNAGYAPNKNTIDFPAGILQGAFFNYNLPKYMNYGGIGFVIGHEITHGFDDQGRQYDKDGNVVDWWASSTKEKYLIKAQCIIDQYGNYTVEEIGRNLKGRNTQGENIADNGGMKMAYLAYNNWAEQNPLEPMLPGLPFTPKQMFWINSASSWCTVYRPRVLASNVATDEHSPAEFRILGPLSNMPEFSKDFNCKIGSKMNPEKKCSLW